MLRLLLLFNSHRPRGRVALSIAGIALGVALGYAVHLVNRAAVEDVAAAVRSVAGEADIEVRGGRAGFSESLYPAIAKLPGVSLVSPVLELDVGIAGTERTLRVIGLDILRAAVLQPALVMEERYDLISPDKLFLSAAAGAASTRCSASSGSSAAASRAWCSSKPPRWARSARYSVWRSVMDSRSSRCAPGAPISAPASSATFFPRCAFHRSAR